MLQGYISTAYYARDDIAYPIPVADKELHPGPKYSTMAPVPPLTVKIPAVFKIMSDITRQFIPRGVCNDNTFGRSPSGQMPSQLDTNDLGRLQFPGKICHHIDCVSTADTDGAHTQASLK